MLVTRKLWACLLDGPRWIVGRRRTYKVWKRTAVSRVSVVTSVNTQTPSDLRQELPSTGAHEVKSFQSEWKKMLWVRQSELYFFVLLTAAVFAAPASVMALCWRVGTIPKVSTTVTSHVALRPKFQGSNVKPSGRLSSSQTRPCGSFMLGTPVRVSERRITSLTYSCDVWYSAGASLIEQGSPADAVKPARRKSMPKLLQFDVFRFISPNSICPNCQCIASRGRPMFSQVLGLYSCTQFEIRCLPIIKFLVQIASN